MLSTTQQPHDEHRKTILVVDDEPLSLKYFKSSVGPYAEVLTAVSADAARKILAAEGDRISVVVSDERMPQDSGVSFLTDVRKSWPSTVRILTSAYTDFASLQKAINGAAIHRFVPKPWNLDELCTTMKDALLVERQETKASDTDEGGEVIAHADVQLLAVLAREMLTPIGQLEAEAVRLASLAGARPATPSPTHQSHTAAWSAQLHLGQIANAADQMRKEARYCRSLAASITELANGLSGALAPETPSMAETAAGAMEQLNIARTDRRALTLDARQDFRYRAPSQLMKFVLVNVIQAALRQVPAEGPGVVSVELLPGNDENEVRITRRLSDGDSDHDIARDQNDKLERVVRSALWAFDGELLHSSDTTARTMTTHIRLPKPTKLGKQR